MTVVELEAGAKLHRHRGYSKLKKAEFVKLLENRTQNKSKKQNYCKEREHQKGKKPFPISPKKKKDWEIEKETKNNQAKLKKNKKEKNIKQVN